MWTQSPDILLAAWHLSVLDEPARLMSPEYLLLAGAVLLLGSLLSWVMYRRLALARKMVPERLRAKVIPGFSASRPILRAGISVLSLVLLSLGLTQPQCGVGTETVHRAGIDLVVVLDASRSMLATDVKPSRFERATLELAALLEELRGDRFGLVAFAATPIIQTPLTTDRRAAAMYLRAVHPTHMPRQGTNIGAGLRTAHRMLTDGPRGSSQVVMLISDGEDHHGDARETARALADDGIVIFTIGIGTMEGEIIDLAQDRSRRGGVHRDRRGDPVISRLDEQLLRDIADIGGGSYVNTRGRGIGVAEVLLAIRGMEQDEREVVEIVQYADQSIWLLFPGFLLLLGGALLRPGREVKRAGGALALVALLFFSMPSEAEARRLLQSQHPAVEQGNKAYAEGRYDEAIAAYEAALDDTLEPSQRAAVHYNRGTALAAKGDVESARRAFDASIALGEPRTQARDFYNLGTALLLTGDAKAAAEALVESLRRDAGNRAAQHNLELALRALQQPPPEGESGEPDGEGGDPQESQDDESEEGQEPDSEEDQENEDDQQESEEDEEGEGEGESSQGSEDDEEGDEDQTEPESDEEGDEDQTEPESDEEGDEDQTEPESDEEGDDESDQEDDAGEDEGEDQRDEGDETDEDTEGDEDGDPDGEADGEEQDEGDREEERDDASDEDDATESQVTSGEGEEEEEAMGAGSPEQVEIDEQDVEAILDALQARERPLQPYLFRPPAEMESPAADGEDW